MQKTHLDILVVEDSSFDRTVVSLEMKTCRYDHSLFHAGSLEEARRLCARGRAPFDLVLLDLNLPDCGGTQTLREMLEISGHVPIVVLTGDDREATATEVADLGAQDHLVKNENIGAALRKAIMFVVTRRRKTAELQRNVDILSKAALLDPLTGISNRRSMDRAVQSAWQRFEETGEETTCILIDLDHFSEVNNQHGHAAGDEVLRSTAVTLASKARSQDVVCRYGGEEFCLLLPNTKLRDGWRLAERIRLGIEEDWVKFDDHSIRVTASLGVATTSIKMDDAMDLIKRADQALYRAKEGSRNTVVTEEELAPLESILTR